MYAFSIPSVCWAVVSHSFRLAYADNIFSIPAVGRRQRVLLIMTA